MLITRLLKAHVCHKYYIRVIPCQLEQGCNHPTQIFMKRCWNLVSSAGRYPVIFFFLLKFLAVFVLMATEVCPKIRT